MLEHELRESMAEETAHLSAAPDLVSQVVRLSQRRRRRRWGVVAIAAAMTLSGFFVVNRDIPVATSTSYNDELPDVSLRYLPPGLGRPSLCQNLVDGTLTGDCLTWADDALRVRSFRSVPLGDLDKPSFIDDPKSVTVRGRTGRISADGTNLVWAERPTWAVWVSVKDPKELLPVVNGLRFRGVTDDVLEGLRVGYVPDTVFPGARRLAPSDWTERTWTGDGGAWVSLSALRGTDATNLDKFVQSRAGDLINLRREGKRYRAHYLRAGRGEALLWLETRGLGFMLAAGGGMEGELDRIAAGIELLGDPPWPGSVDGVEVHYLPSGFGVAGMQTTELGKGWSAVSQRWTAKGDPARFVAVSAFRGGSVTSSREWRDRMMGAGEWQDVVMEDSRTGHREAQRQRDCMIYSGRNEVSLLVRVCVSADLSGELERIVAQTEAPWR